MTPRRAAAGCVVALALLSRGAPAFADADHVLEQAAVFDPTVHFGKVGAMTFQPLLQTMFDGETTSIVPPNAALGVLATSGPQVTARLQLVVAL